MDIRDQISLNHEWSNAVGLTDPNSSAYKGVLDPPTGNSTAGLESGISTYGSTYFPAESSNPVGDMGSAGGSLFNSGSGTGIFSPNSGAFKTLFDNPNLSVNQPNNIINKPLNNNISDLIGIGLKSLTDAITGNTAQAIAKTSAAGGALENMNAYDKSQTQTPPPEPPKPFPFLTVGIVGALVIGLGVGIYFMVKKPKGK